MAEILIINDEESIRFTLDTFLSDEGHSVSTAASYDEAVARMNATEFDLIFSDMLLGDRTGLDVLREVKNRNLKCPVIMITAHTDAEMISEAFRLGAFYYLQKPVNQETIVNAARAALQHGKVKSE